MDLRRSVLLRRHLAFWLLAAGGCALDLWSKHWMFSQPQLAAGQVWWLWPGHVGFQLSLNEGALFGMGQGGGKVFAALAAAAAVGIPIWLFRSGSARDLRLTIALGAIMGGVLGNLYDRAGLPGLEWGQFVPARAGEPVYAVRDFILLAWKWDGNWQNRVVWPNFNLADSFLVCGALALVYISLRPVDAQGGRESVSSKVQNPMS